FGSIRKEEVPIRYDVPVLFKTVESWKGQFKDEPFKGLEPFEHTLSLAEQTRIKNLFKDIFQHNGPCTGGASAEFGSDRQSGVQLPAWGKGHLRCDSGPTPPIYRSLRDKKYYFAVPQVRDCRGLGGVTGAPSGSGPCATLCRRLFLPACR